MSSTLWIYHQIKLIMSSLRKNYGCNWFGKSQPLSKRATYSMKYTVPRHFVPILEKFSVEIHDDNLGPKNHGHGNKSNMHILPSL